VGLVITVSDSMLFLFSLLLFDGRSSEIEEEVLSTSVETELNAARGAVFGVLSSKPMEGSKR
jgi:hypothetical protein